MSKLDSLIEALNNPAKGQRFLILNTDREMTNFIRYVPQADGKTIYLGSFNSVGYQGVGLGKPFFASVVSTLGKEHDLKLTCDPTNPALKVYQELGFRAVGEMNIRGRIVEGREIPDSRRAQVVMVRPAGSM